MPAATLPDGASIAHDVYDFTDPWLRPEMIILVHGFTENRRFWHAWIPQLARRYRVICMDQRGHGASTPPLITGAKGQQGTLNSAREATRTISDCRFAVLEGMPFNVMSAVPEACVHETLRFLNDVVTGKCAREHV